MNANTTPLVINEGKTLNYLIPIVFCALAALVSFVFSSPLGLLLILTCVILGLVETGLEFDLQTMKYRKFKSVFGSRWGDWMEIQEPDSFHLRLSVESHTYRTYTMGTGPSYYGNGRATSKSITYDIMVQTKADNWIIIYEFLSYKLALQLVRRLQEMETVEVTDHIALRLQENQEKRAGRRR